jgi:hypothetical protein
MGLREVQTKALKNPKESGKDAVKMQTRRKEHEIRYHNGNHKTCHHMSRAISSYFIVQNSQNRKIYIKCDNKRQNDFYIVAKRPNAAEMGSKQQPTVSHQSTAHKQ